MALRSASVSEAAPAAGEAAWWAAHRAWAVPAAALFAWLAALAFVQAPGADESVYALVAGGIADGRWPYRGLFDHKQPLLYAWYLPAGLGAGIEVQRLIGAALLAASCWPMHRLALRVLGDRPRATLVVVSYALMLANPFMMASTNAEAYVLLPLLAAFVAPTALVAGALLGVAVMTKGLALVFLPVMVVRWRGASWRALSGMTVVGAAVAAAFAPVWREALDANVAFNAEYAAYAGEGLWARLLVDPWVMLGTLPVWLAAIAGAWVLRHRTAWLLLLCGALSVKAAPFDFAHYYALLAPGAAIFAAAGADALLRRFGSLERRRAARLTFAGAAALVSIPAVALFALSLAYQATEPAPYADVAAAASRIDGELYVLGNAPQLYVQAGREPQRRLFFAAPLAVRDRWGAAMRAELLACPPAALVVPKDDVFPLAWTADITARYATSREFTNATLYTGAACPAPH